MTTPLSDLLLVLSKHLERLREVFEGIAEQNEEVQSGDCLSSISVGSVEGLQVYASVRARQHQDLSTQVEGGVRTDVSNRWIALVRRVSSLPMRVEVGLDPLFSGRCRESQAVH
jgi:hypothetical protein